MNPRHARLLATALAFALGAPTAALSAAATPQRLAIHSGGFEALGQSRSGTAQAGHAFVQRPVRVSHGEWSIDDLPLVIDPSTVQLQGEGVLVQSQRYDFSTADHAQLLQNAIGQTISVEQNLMSGLREHTGVLVAVGNGLSLREADGRLRVLSTYSSFSLARMPESLVLRPTLRFRLDTGGIERDARLDYATAGLAWRAEYRASLQGGGNDCRMSLTGHAMVVNRSGIDFNAVALDLIAGDANRRIEQMTRSDSRLPVLAEAMAVGRMSAEAMPAVVASGEGHRYTLPGTHDLPNGSLQRLPLIAAVRPIPCERRLVAERPGPDWMPDTPMLHREIGADGEVPVRSRLVFRNDPRAGLGMPLPAGRLRAFDAGEFLGEAELGHTAAGRELDLDLGGAFDVSAERRTLDFQLDPARSTMLETVEWTLRNGKNKDTLVHLGDRLPRWTDWRLVEGAEHFEKRGAQRIEARVRVPAGGETVLRYSVRYRWTAATPND